MSALKCHFNFSLKLTGMPCSTEMELMSPAFLQCLYVNKLSLDTFVAIYPEINTYYVNGTCGI